MKYLRPYTGVLILTAVLTVLLSGVALYFHRTVGYVAVAVSVAIFLAVFIWLHTLSKRQDDRMDQVFGDNAAATSRILRSLSVPLLLCDQTGKIVWRNDAFAALYDGIFLKAILPQFAPDKPLGAQQHTYAGNSYQVMTMRVERGRAAAKTLYFQYWLDRTEAANYQRLYAEQRPYVMLAYIDNLEEMTGDSQFHSTTVLAEVEKLISAMCKRTEGVYRRYENGRFLCILEAKQLEALEKEKFTLLESAHRIVGVSDGVQPFRLRHEGAIRNLQ